MNLCTNKRENLANTTHKHQILSKCVNLFSLFQVSRKEYDESLESTATAQAKTAIADIDIDIAKWTYNEDDQCYRYNCRCGDLYEVCKLAKFPRYLDA